MTSDILTIGLALSAVLLALLIIAVLMSEYLSLEAGAFFLANAKRRNMGKQADVARSKYLDQVRSDLGLTKHGKAGAEAAAE
jgi:hypothetical protein